MKNSNIKDIKNSFERAGVWNVKYRRNTGKISKRQNEYDGSGRITGDYAAVYQQCTE